jgi:hypothetical protein
LLIIGLNAYVLDALQLAILENSTATPPILGVPHPVPTLHDVPLIVTAVIVAVLKPFASVCTNVGSLTVIELPFVLDHTN